MRCMFQQSYTGIQAPIHDTAFTYGRTISTTTDEGQRQEYNTGGQRRKALLLRVQHPKATNLHLLVAMAE